MAPPAKLSKKFLKMQFLYALCSLIAMLCSFIKAQCASYNNVLTQGIDLFDNEMFFCYVFVFLLNLGLQFSWHKYFVETVKTLRSYFKGSFL